jgi:glutamyl-Q tRNA(Asp) synthetase
MVAAAASWLDARWAGGKWIVRMEDLDTPRNRPGAVDAILRTLDFYGLASDEPVLYQSARTEIYHAALGRLIRSGAAFPCGCTRAEAGERYPGTCRNGLPAGRTARAWRVRTEPAVFCFDDRLQGQCCYPMDDFVVLRADGLFAYQLAVVVDDAEQGITDVVRGADLLDSTPRQMWLQRLLGVPSPSYLHVPVALNAEGQKLSKQTLSPAVRTAPAVLRSVLSFLGVHVEASTVDGCWAEAIALWSPQTIVKALSLPAPIEFC